jgi:hypothetical protein
LEQPDKEWIVREDRVGGPVTTAETIDDDPPGPQEAELVPRPVGREASATSRDIAGYHYRAEKAGVATLESVVRRVPTYNVRATRIVRYVMVTAEVLIGIRFMLELLGASTDAAFVALVYSLTVLLVAPFQGAFAPGHHGALVFEPASLVALVIYPLLAAGIVVFIKLYAARRTPWSSD